jgi:2-keto-4-pentenoate hydratase/2-oxohepta-3-ene-1,7-dioic acid hydratase in catechol pathway
VAIGAIGDLQNLALETRLNGELVQQANTGSMIFSVANLIAQLSTGTTLVAGTVILTGTPAGVGMGRSPQRFLRDGDVVEVRIEGVGVLRNPVVAVD